MEERTKEKLCHHYDTIAKELDTADVVLYLSRTVLSQYECDKMSRLKNRQDRAKYLLDILVMKGPLAYHHFRSALGECYPHLVKKLDEESAPPITEYKEEVSGRVKFQRRDSLINNLKTEGVLDFLERGGVLSRDDCNKVKAGMTNEDKARVLVDMIPERGPAACREFKLAVKTQQPKLADLLD